MKKLVIENNYGDICWKFMPEKVPALKEEITILKYK